MVIKELANPTETDASFIDTEQLLRRLPISRRTLMNWRANGKIPFIRMGGKRVIFHWDSVREALLRHQRATVE